jgi:hypothetical protein
VQFLELGDLLAVVRREQMIGFLPMTPGTTPSRVATTTRWPTRICASQPPIPMKRRKPESSTCVTISPISSLWPTIATDGPSAVPRTRAHTDPMTSVVTSAKEEAACAKTRAGAVS